MRKLECREPGRYASKANADRFHRELEQQNHCGTKKESNDISGNSLYITHENDNHRERSHGQSRLDGRERGEIMHNSLNASEKFSWHLLDLQPKEILQLRAGDNDRNAVCETNDYRPRHEFHRRA